MSLSTGRGPLGPRPAGRLVPTGSGTTYVEPHRRRVRALRNGHTVIDSDAVLLVHRPGEPPSYAFPATDVAGLASIEEPAAPGFVRLAWDAVDRWFEEDEEVVGHPRNPYHRVECLRTHRRLRVTAGATLVVDTTHTMAVFETALDPRLYVERAQLTTGRLEPSPTTSYCPYKGIASYWNLVVDDLRVPDAAWSYEAPLLESVALGGLVSFDETKVTVSTGFP